MKLGDLTVEVRDKGLNRLGLIRPEDLNLTMVPAFNNVGTWSLKIASEHPLAPALRTPGAGIIVTGANDVLMSGPSIAPTSTSSKDDPQGSLTIDGVSDEIVLADMLAFPDPTNVDPTTQTLAHDTRTGSAEAVIHGFVKANIGPSAPAARRKANLIMGAMLNRGPTLTKSARFPVLGNLIADVASVANIGFRVVQRGTQLVFETYVVVDRSKLIRLDVRNNTLTSQKVALTAPGTTVVIVAGQGEMEDRTFYQATNTDAHQAELDWGRRIETFVDQRQTDDMNEYVQKAAEVLSQQGFTGVTVQGVPMDDTTMVFGKDWGMGDRVSVVVDAGEYISTVTGYTLMADADGTRVGVTIGDATALDPTTAAWKQLDSTAQRVSALEANGVPAPGTTASTQSVNDGAVMALMGVW